MKIMAWIVATIIVLLAACAGYYYFIWPMKEEAAQELLDRKVQEVISSNDGPTPEIMEVLSELDDMYRYTVVDSRMSRLDNILVVEASSKDLSKGFIALINQYANTDQASLTADSIFSDVKEIVRSSPAMNATFELEVNGKDDIIFTSEFINFLYGNIDAVYSYFPEQ